MRRLSVDTFEVYELYARFSEESVYGCEVQWLVTRYEWEPVGLYFRELCREVRYDRDGQVLPFSHPSALPLRKLSWEYAGNLLRIRESE